MFNDEDHGSRIKLIILCISILLFGIFLGKNYTPTPVWIFGWTPSLPLILIALGCFLLGCGCGWALSALIRKRLTEK